MLSEFGFQDRMVMSVSSFGTCLYSNFVDLYYFKKFEDFLKSVSLRFQRGFYWSFYCFCIKKTDFFEG